MAWALFFLADGRYWLKSVGIRTLFSIPVDSLGRPFIKHRAFWRAGLCPLVVNCYPTTPLGKAARFDAAQSTGSMQP